MLLWVVDVAFLLPEFTDSEPIAYNISDLSENFDCISISDCPATTPLSNSTSTSSQLNEKLAHLFANKPDHVKVFVKDTLVEEFLYEFCKLYQFNLVQANIVNLEKFNIDNYSREISLYHPTCGSDWEGHIYEHSTHCPGQSVKKIFKFLKKHFNIEASWDQK